MNEMRLCNIQALIDIIRVHGLDICRTLVEKANVSLREHDGVIACESVIWSATLGQEVSSGHSANERSRKSTTNFALGLRVWCRRRRMPVRDVTASASRDVIDSRTWVPRDASETTQEMFDRINRSLHENPLPSLD